MLQAVGQVEEVSILKNRLAELEEEKGSLQLKLVDFDDVKALQGEINKYNCVRQTHKFTLKHNLNCLPFDLYVICAGLNAAIRLAYLQIRWGIQINISYFS